MKIRKYIITAREHYGKRRTIFYSHRKSEAMKELQKLLSPPKRRGKIILTSYREGKSGTGIVNPRIRKIWGHK